MIVGERPRVRLIEAADATGMSVSNVTRAAAKDGVGIGGHQVLEGEDHEVGMDLRDLRVGDGGGVYDPRRRP